MENYIGSALCFPIKGRDEVGMTVMIDMDDLAFAADSYPPVKDNDVLILTILPLKPENVTNKKTHSVKLIDVKKYED